MDGNKNLSVCKAAERIGLSRSKFYALLSAGEGPPVVRFGRRVLIREADLDTWVAEHVQEFTP